MMKNIVICVLCLLVARAEIASAEGIKTPEEQFSGYPTRIEDIPVPWVTTNPILTRVCFNLKYPVNSTEADAFLRELYKTVSGLKFVVTAQIERPVYPVEYAYCVSLRFRNWEDNRRYENSEEFLRFYNERWKSDVTKTSEALSVLDRVAAEDQ